jgi:16S rRNA (cytosine967-C5)-methyltransferase
VILPLPFREGGQGVRSRLEPHPFVPDAWLLDRGELEQIEPLLAAGKVVVQDPASQLVALLAAPRPGQRVADLCAAPGGKAAHLAALMGGEGVVIATDRDKERLAMLRENIARLAPHGVEVHDWAMAEMLLAAPEPDIILIDAPCTGWGTVRHKPDLKWRRRDPAALAAAQRQLLRDAAPHLGPGGVLVYSVCTFLPAETDEVMHAFLSEHPAFRVQDAREVLPPQAHALVSDDGTVRTWPHRHRCDGFFAVRLVNSN